MYVVHGANSGPVDIWGVVQHGRSDLLGCGRTWGELTFEAWYNIGRSDLWGGVHGAILPLGRGTTLGCLTFEAWCYMGQSDLLWLGAAWGDSYDLLWRGTAKGDMTFRA